MGQELALQEQRLEIDFDAILNRECRPGIRVAFRALHCGEVQVLNDDLQVISPALTLFAAPPINQWPKVVRRIDVPADVEQLQLEPLTAERP